MGKGAGRASGDRAVGKGQAMSLETRSVENLCGTPVSYAYAVKAGPWLFLTGHEAWDWRSGAIAEAVSGPPSYPLFGPRHRSRREADFIFDRIKELHSNLERRGHRAARRAVARRAAAPKPSVGPDNEA